VCFNRKQFLLTLSHLEIFHVVSKIISRTDASISRFVASAWICSKVTAEREKHSCLNLWITENSTFLRLYSSFSSPSDYTSRYKSLLTSLNKPWIIEWITDVGSVTGIHRLYWRRLDGEWLLCWGTWKYNLKFAFLRIICSKQQWDLDKSMKGYNIQELGFAHTFKEFFPSIFFLIIIILY